MAKKGSTAATDNILEALVATTDDIQKYAGLNCSKAYPLFKDEFNERALDNRPFVNFFLYGLNNGIETISIHDNYSIFDSGYYGTENKLDAMINNYLIKGIQETSIRFVKPPLIITDAASKENVKKAFERNGYTAFNEIPQKTPRVRKHSSRYSMTF